MTAVLDMNGVLQAAYNRGTNTLNVTVVVGTASGSVPEDANGVWANVYDQATNSLRIVYV